MRFEASKAFDGRKGAFSNCAVSFPVSLCLALHALFGSMLRVWLGPKLS